MKKIALLIVFILVLFFGLILAREESRNFVKKILFPPRSVYWSDLKDFTIKKENGKNVIKHKDSGLYALVSENWKIIKNPLVPEKEFWIELQKLNTVIENDLHIAKGCRLGIGVVYDKKRADRTAGAIKEIQSLPDKTYYYEDIDGVKRIEAAVLEIDKHNALYANPSFYENKNEGGLIYSDIEIPLTENSVVWIGLQINNNIEDIEACSRDFTEFINNLRFN